MGKLFDAMNKFDDSKKSKEKVRKERNNKKQINRLNAQMQAPNKLSVQDQEKEKKADTNHIEPKPNTTSINETEIEKTRTKEAQYDAVEQVAPSAQIQKNLGCVEETINLDKIRTELKKCRQEYGQLNFKKAVNIKRKIIGFEWLKKRNTFLHSNSNTTLTEYFNIIRSNIFAKLEEKKRKTILITSVAPSDGKSTIAANLSLSIAMGLDKHILLIDTDYRRPTVHRYFGIKETPGLLDYLIDHRIDFEQIQHKSFAPKLSVIPAGNHYENSSGIISSKTMKLFIQDVKHSYDDRIIMFDSPPIILADSLSMSSMVDGLILVVKSNKTDKKIVKHIVDRIGKDKILGIVVNYHKNKKTDYYTAAYRY